MDKIVLAVRFDIENTEWLRLEPKNEEKQNYGKLCVDQFPAIYAGF